MYHYETKIAPYAALARSVAGRDVEITWRDGGDWKFYTVLDLDPAGWLLLRGRDDGDEAYVRGDFWASLADVDTIELEGGGR